MIINKYSLKQKEKKIKKKIELFDKHLIALVARLKYFEETNKLLLENKEKEDQINLSGKFYKGKNPGLDYAGEDCTIKINLDQYYNSKQIYITGNCFCSQGKELNANFNFLTMPKNYDPIKILPKEAYKMLEVDEDRPELELAIRATINKTNELFGPRNFVSKFAESIDKIALSLITGKNKEKIINEYLAMREKQFNYLNNLNQFKA